MSQSQTTLHYAPNSNFSSSGAYLPGADGFNLADLSSVDQVNSLPSGVTGLVWLGMEDGVTSAFINAVTPFIGNPNVYGFYLADEPDPSSVSAANLKAESDWIHTHDPGAKTFMVEYNSGTPTQPSYAFTPANTDIDLFGLDPYPIRPASEGSEFATGADYGVINAAVAEANSIGIPTSDIVPVYQAFGGGDYSSWTLPTASQETEILNTWGSLVPAPAFDYAYSWGVQDGDSAIDTTPALQTVFAAHNSDGGSTGGGGTGGGGTGGGGTGGGGTGGGGTGGGGGSSPGQTSTTITMTATDSNGTTQSVPVLNSGTVDFTGNLSGSVDQQVVSGTDTISASAGISTLKVAFTSGNADLNFVGGASLVVQAGSGTDVVTATSAHNSFTAGAGTLDVTAASRYDSYTFHAGDGLLTVADFSVQKHDKLIVDKSLKSSLKIASDGHGGTMLTLGASGHGVDLVNTPSFSVANIHFA